MTVDSCIPVIPSKDLEKSLRFWVDGLGFSTSRELRKNDKLIFCMLRKDNLWLMLNRRAGTPVRPKDYEGIRLYWAPRTTETLRNPERSTALRAMTMKRFSWHWAWQTVHPDAAPGHECESAAGGHLATAEELVSRERQSARFQLPKIVCFMGVSLRRKRVDCPAES